MGKTNLSSSNQTISSPLSRRLQKKISGFQPDRLCWVQQTKAKSKRWVLYQEKCFISFKSPLPLCQAATYAKTKPVDHSSLFLSASSFMVDVQVMLRLQRTWLYIYILKLIMNVGKLNRAIWADAIARWVTNPAGETSALYPQQEDSGTMK